MLGRYAQRGQPLNTLNLPSQAVHSALVILLVPSTATSCSTPLPEKPQNLSGHAAQGSARQW